MAPAGVPGASGDDGEDVAGRAGGVLLAGVLDLGAAVLAVDHLVADVDVERDAVAVVVDAAGADRQDLALLGLLLGGVGDDQTRRRGLLGVQRLDDDPVLEGLDVDRHVVDLHFLHSWGVGFAVLATNHWHTHRESANPETSTLARRVPARGADCEDAPVELEDVRWLLTGEGQRLLEQAGGAPGDDPVTDPETLGHD